MTHPDRPDVFWEGPVKTRKASKKPGVIHVGVDDRSIVCCTVRGHFEPAMAQLLIETSDELVARQGYVVGFGDWYGMESYEQACRTSLTNWAVSLGPKFVAFHLLVGTTLVRMGVTVASMFVKALHNHSNVEDFRRAYEQARRTEVKPPP
jgi:hypothetical protein